MHRILQIPEIVASICREIPPLSRGRLHRETSAILAALARTCKAFSGPALNILWRHPFLVDLLTCMPDDLWEFIGDPTSSAPIELVLHRPVVLSDWERLLVCTQRVKGFSHYYDDNLDCPLKIFEVLRLCLPRQHLFPNIETLNWIVKEDPIFLHVPLFLGPRLTALCLGILSTATHLSFLGTVTTQCPLLAEVEIMCCRDMDSVNRLQSLSSFVRGLNSLKKLTLPCLDRMALAHIAQLPTFVSLTLTDPIIAAPNPPGSHHFANLQFLHIRDATAVDVLLELFTLLLHSPAVDILASFPNQTPSPKIAQLYTALAPSPSRTSLSTLKLLPKSWQRVERLSDTATAAECISSHQMRPLLTFLHLTSVTLCAPAGFDLNDATVGDMARAWPRIESLHLYASDYAHTPSNVTLGALVLLARHCPELSGLSLTLDATAPVPDLETENERLRQWRLESLGVSLSPIAAPLAVAVFLSSVFPELKWVRGDDMQYKSWEEVEKALPALRKARAEEEHWFRRGKS